MRLINYLNESIYPKYSIERMVKLVKEDCQPWIKDIKGKVAYRGMDNKPGFFKAKVRTKRNPLDTPIEIQNLFDSSCKKIYKWKPRSRGLFCTGEKERTRAFGELYMIWPIGSFKFIWSDKIVDFYHEIIEIFIEYRILHNVKTSNEKLSEYKEIKQQVEKLVKNSYTDKDIYRALKQGNEIMVRCKEYYAISDNEYGYEFLSLLKGE